MKAKVTLLIAVLLTAAMTVVAQSANANPVIETRTSKPYHYIHIKGEMNVKLVQDEMPGITVAGNQYQVDNTVTMLLNDTLFVYQTNIRNADGRVFIMINVENISFLEVRGKTKVDCSGLINTDFLTIRAHDGARIKLDVHALKVDSKATGSSFIYLSGSVASTVERTDGTGAIDSRLLDAMDRKATLVKYCISC